MENRENISIDRIISRYRRTGSERIYREVCKCAGEIPCASPDKPAEQLDDFAQQGMEMFVEYMYEHFEEFKLLVNGSYGTKFQNFVEHLVDIETEYTYKFMEATGLHFKGGKPVTKNFMHIMNKALFESFFEVVRHDMSKEEAEEYVVMLEKYHSAGWDIIYKEGCES